MDAQQTETQLFAALGPVRQWVDEAIEQELAQWQGPEPLLNAMRYAVHSGGKRIRPILAVEIARFLGGSDAVMRVLPAACALEWIHTYSLIHDDLPAMDDDDERRGKPAVHRAFGEAIAILAGDALQAEAFELTLDATKGDRPAGMRAQQALSIAKWAGARGMCGGQTIDILGLAKTTEQLRAMHVGKTAALFVCACEIAAMAASCSEEQIDTWADIGIRIGLAFQLSDDALDIEDIPDSEHEADVNLAQKMGKEATREQIKKDGTEAHILLRRMDVPSDHIVSRVVDWIMIRAEDVLS